MLGVELKAKLFVVVVEGVPKVLIGFPNRPLEPDCVVAPKPALIPPKPNLRYETIIKKINNRNSSILRINVKLVSPEVYI